MENAGDEGQFDSLSILNRQPTLSQEEKLKLQPFARESEVFSGGMQSSSSTDEASEQATGIIMISLPESSDDYQTPPEQHTYSQNSSNDGQVPATKMAAADREMESGGVGDGEGMVADDGCELKGQRTVDLSNESDNLGLLEKSPRVLLEDNNTLMDDDTDQIEAEYKFNETEAGNWVTEALETGYMSSPKESTHKVSAGMPLREQEGTRGERRLPFSVNGEKKDSREEGDYSKHEALRDSLNRALKLLLGEVKGGSGGDEDDRDVDFIETAKSRGLTFPRPRWWPPEGFED